MTADGKSTASLPVLRKQPGALLEGYHLLKTTLQMPNKRCRTLRGVGSLNS